MFGVLGMEGDHSVPGPGDRSGKHRQCNGANRPELRDVRTVEQHAVFRDGPPVTTMAPGPGSQPRVHLAPTLDAPIASLHRGDLSQGVRF